ncbi:MULTISPECIES: hypothetical protein [Kitasatospora]|uniref:DUF4034 domain-containing protein n=1 Tax=Kitasatospora setae (strain ATCC 33774 / DSM 43861 / JCM 3304 / KCC A-0304 / NBRC 14216 / KM-6054) TaxID=452652 RepID=E4N0T8_KITSK|nr:MULTISPECIES: hypothetical protein [Kitasatospora]BAJ31772.1 hypothetical protein KSE_60030 [Kitasatospora setae KM-6054]
MTPVLVFALAALIMLLTRRRNDGGRGGFAAELSAGLAAVEAAGFDPAAHGLVPSAELDPGRAGPPMRLLRRKELEALADSCLAGGWRAAEAYVAGAGADWDERWSRLDFLTRVAAERDEWLTDWEAAGTAPAAAATVRARLLVQRAWEARGSGFPAQIGPERMAAFRTRLPAAYELARQAAEADGRDPGPWVVMITAARGMRVSRRKFRALWAELVARAPHHVGGHWQAMQYWCAKWHGSDTLMLRFAVRAVREAPAGSPLPGLYLQALTELELRHGPGGLPERRRHRELLPRVAAALDEVPPGNDQVPLLRHLLAHYALLSRQPALALEQFRLIGPWCGALPWSAAPNPVRAFDRARGLAATLAAGSGNEHPGAGTAGVGERPDTDRAADGDRPGD